MQATIFKNNKKIELHHCEKFHIRQIHFPSKRAHYGFQATSAHFLDFASFKLDNNNKLKTYIAHASWQSDRVLDVDEFPEDLIQRLI